MGEPVTVALGRGSNKGRFPQAGTASHVNAYFEEIGEEGKTTTMLVCINGWEEFCTLTNGAGVRAMKTLDNILLAVAGRLLFSAPVTGTSPLTVGGIPSDGFVTMAHNGKTPNKQMAIVCDGLWFLYEGGTLTQGADPDLPPPICVVESDGYLFFPIRDGRFFIAGPNEGSAVDPLDFAEAESSSDINVMAAVRGRTFIPMGERSLEFWDPNGDPVFPYARTSAIDVGCYAAGTVANVLVTKGGNVRDMIVFAGTDSEGSYAGIMALEGYEPVIISTSEIDRLVRDEPNKDDLRCMAWTEDGHGFYTLSGTAFSKTWDGKIGSWHDRKSHLSERWSAGCVAQLGGQTLFGSATSNKIYRSRPALFDEAGAPIVWQVQPPPIHAFPGGFIINAIYADFITGVGVNTGSETDDDPEVIFDYSKDGGVSFGAERRLKLGRTGERWRSVKIRGLGRADKNGITLRFRIPANVAKGLQQIKMDVTQTR